MRLPLRVLATLRKYRMIPRGGRVMVALSGGPDSVALTLVLRELEGRGGFRLAGLAHVNHGLREAASGDEAFCRALAERIGVPFFVEHVDVRDLARRERRSIEDAGRTARYDFFRRVLHETGAEVAATGHTRDDQAETFLLRLLRGAGARGLAGIHPVAGPVVRPLIEVRRRDVCEYLAERHQAYCEDESNRDRSIPRNRIRQELIPYIERAFSPGIVGILAREADAARLDEAHLALEAIGSAGLIVLRTSGRRTVPLASGGASPVPAADVAAVEIDADGLASLSQAVASRVARLALSILAPDRFVGFDHVEAVLALASAGGGRASLPGQQAVRRRDIVELVRDPVRGFENSFSQPLSIPGEVLLADQGWVVSAEGAPNRNAGPARQEDPGGRPDATAAGAPALTAEVRADRIVSPLRVRSRQRGDRFQPPGLGGRHKKLQDYLVDRKVPLDERDRLPLVVDGDDRIVWVAGHGVGEDFRVTAPSQGVIFLKARQLGGPG